VFSRVSIRLRLQNESERLQAQVSGLRLQQSRDAENQQLLVAGLTEQLKG